MEWLKHLTICRNEDGILVNDLLQGKHYIKFETGLLSYEYNYIDGRKQSTQYSWFSDGDIHYEENWLNDQIHGRCIKCGIASRIYKIEIWKYGKLYNSEAVE